MRTIEEAAKEYANISIDFGRTTDLSVNDEFENCQKDFTAGAEFMQKEYEEKLRWIPIEYDKDGFCTDKCNNEIVESLPVIMKDEDGNIDIYYKIDKEIRFRNKFYRPIEL